MFESNIAEFPILKRRFERQFFGNILSNYLIFLFELSNRLRLDPVEMCKEYLALLYTEKTEALSPYSICILELLIYGERTDISSKETLFLESDRRLFLAFVHGFLAMKSFSDVKIQLELFRLTGLLIVNYRLPLGKKQRNPVFLNLTYGVLNYSSQTQLQESIENYAADFKKSADHTNKVKGFGRSYITATGEFAAFLKTFISEHTRYLSPQLKDVLEQGFRNYRKKSCFPDTDLISYLQMNSPSLSVYNANVKMKYSL